MRLALFLVILPMLSNAQCFGEVPTAQAAKADQKENKTVPPEIKIASATYTQAALSSKPVEKDGLQVTATLPKAILAVDEPLRLELHFRNVGRRAFSVDAAPPRGWRIKVTAKDAAKGETTSWEAREMASSYSKPLTIPKDQGMGWVLKNIRFMEWVEAGLTFITDGGTGVTKAYTSSDGKKEIPLRQHLPPGKYSLVAVFAFNPPPPPPRGQSPATPTTDAPLASPANAEAVIGWTGRVTTEPIEFEITDQPAVTKETKKE